MLHRVLLVVKVILLQPREQSEVGRCYRYGHVSFLSKSQCLSTARKRCSVFESLVVACTSGLMKRPWIFLSPAFSPGTITILLSLNTWNLRGMRSRIGYRVRLYVVMVRALSSFLVNSELVVDNLVNTTSSSFRKMGESIGQLIICDSHIAHPSPASLPTLS